MYINAEHCVKCVIPPHIESISSVMSIVVDYIISLAQNAMSCSQSYIQLVKTSRNNNSTLILVCSYLNASQML